MLLTTHVAFMTDVAVGNIFTTTLDNADAFAEARDTGANRGTLKNRIPHAAAGCETPLRPFDRTGFQTTKAVLRDSL